MPCKRHSLKVASCPDCTGEYLLEENVLSLGPRTRSQFASLRAKFKATRIPPNIQLYKHRFCHRLHRLALHIAEHVLDATNVADLPAQPHIKALMTPSTTDDFVNGRVQFVGHNQVRAKTPLGMFDIDSLQKGILRANIRGCKMVELASEYAQACADVAQLIDVKIVFTDNFTVWHSDVVPKHSPTAMQTWDALVRGTPTNIVNKKRKL